MKIISKIVSILSTVIFAIAALINFFSAFVWGGIVAGDMTLKEEHQWDLNASHCAWLGLLFLCLFVLSLLLTIWLFVRRKKVEVK